MKLKLFFITLLFFPLPAINAQCKDCFPTKNDWKFAAGVTLQTNMTYPLHSPTNQPLEFDFKYKLNERNLLRASIPIIYKRDIKGYTEYPHYPTEETTLEKYVEDLHSDESSYYNPNIVIDNYYSIYGLSLGYEYSLPIAKKLSLFGGVDLGYTYQYDFGKYYDLEYSNLDANNQTSLQHIYYSTTDYYRNILSTRPTVGLQYQFQKLLIEANVGYYYSFSLTKGITSVKTWSTISQYENLYTNTVTLEFDKITYKISLFYTF